MNAGLLTESASHKLLEIAYSQPGVMKARLEIPQDAEVSSVTFVLSLRSHRKLMLYRRLMSGGLLGRIGAIVIIWTGVPVHVESNIIEAAQGYLPKGYAVDVKLEKPVLSMKDMMSEVVSEITHMIPTIESFWRLATSLASLSLAAYLVMRMMGKIQ